MTTNLSELERAAIAWAEQPAIVLKAGRARLNRIEWDLKRAADRAIAAGPGEPSLGELEKLTQLESSLLDAVKAKMDLLVCYRIGSQPTESLWERLGKADKTIALAESRRAARAQAVAE